MTVTGELSPFDEWMRIQRAVIASLVIAAVGFVLVVTIQLIPVRVSVSGGGSVNCGSPYGLTSGDTGISSFVVGSAQARLGGLSRCGVVLRRRRAAALVLGGLLDLPLAYWAIKGLLWGGRSIALLRQRAEGSG